MERNAFLFQLLLLLLVIHPSVLRAQAHAPGSKPNRKALMQYCAGWIVNVESHNIVSWQVTPPMCQKYIKHYIEGGQYLMDFKIALNASYAFLETLQPTDGKDAMVFDIDETALSNLPYYSRHSYGGELYNNTSFNEYVDEGSAPPLETLGLYKKLQAEKWALIFITGRDEEFRNITTQNLIAAGYSNWDELILRQPEDRGISAAVYKSKKRVELEQKQGFRIRSCIGDQWSDCEGPAAGSRTFKLPNPMYFIA